MMGRVGVFVVFFFNDTATTEIYTLSLHDALPIYFLTGVKVCSCIAPVELLDNLLRRQNKSIHQCHRDWKSTRLNSSH